MDTFSVEDVVLQSENEPSSPLKDWRLKYLAGTLEENDMARFFQRDARKYFEYQYETDLDGTKPSLKVIFKEANAKEGIIDVLLEFILGENPEHVLEKLRQEGNTAAVCGKVFKNGEPTYSCRECGMDPTCVLCVNCFKKSAHRYHKYKMSTSGGGGCCDCGDVEAWKKDHYCELHSRGGENPVTSTIITDSIKERCELAFGAVLSFCKTFLEIETTASLKCLDGDHATDDEFCTVLYNDESHTFDQVIQTLTKIVKCRHKDAMEIVASIDREGRAVVKCDVFNECLALKDSIEKQSVTPNSTMPLTRASQSLRVSVLHVRAVASQQFALQLLTWFQDFLSRHRMFREIFAGLILDKNAKYCLRQILEHDVKLWKTARTCWHRLLISGMLMEYDNKMALAQEFSRHYATVMQDFIRDDHDHSFSIVSLSVQLFTVPSIAHYLIANESILYKLLHTFFHESVEKFIQNKTLHFPKNIASLGFFKRAAYILYDLRYILSFKPDIWTDELREGFIEGFKALLRLLNVMQGMESVTRQTGQHMDYEPEWECAFNLHIKLASSISLVVEWSATDREVLLKVYQMLMRHLSSNSFIVGSTKLEEKTVAGHVAKVNVYDVTSKPVSIHLPLSRLFAGIYLNLGHFGLTFDTAVPLAIKQRTPVEIIEPILCAQAMIAQVHAGMWRRNGYSLLHQLYFYRNVRCRIEMLDRDVVGLQIGASLIESNEYLIHLLNKFNLLEWIQPDYERGLSISPTDDEFIRLLSMIDEFLELLIVIIGERFVPGIANITEDDRIKKEITQLLCIKSYSHSELNRALPDSNNDTALEEVISSVAVFKKPTSPESKGVYVLKEELYDEYNMFFYHYTKEEKSKSEETQRGRRKAKHELVCCPPPKLPKLADSFISIANLLQCDVMMTIMASVLDRALDLKAKSFLDNHLQKVLHLIGYGLQEEQSGNYAFLTFYERSKNYKLEAKLEELSRSSRVEAHRDFILWTLKKFKELKTKEESEVMQSDDPEVSQVEDQSPQAPVTAAEKEKLEKTERARLAAEHRAKIMAQMQNAQKNFIKSNADLYASTSDITVPSGTATPMEWQDGDYDEGAVAYQSVACLGLNRRLQQPEEVQFKCILCCESCNVTKDGSAVVYPAFVQKSKVLATDPKLKASVHTSSCGHAMHADCWQDYYNMEETKEQRRPLRSRPLSSSGIDGKIIEFQCPYCRCISNSVLPLAPSLSSYCVPNVIRSEDEVVSLHFWTKLMKGLCTKVVSDATPEQIQFILYCEAAINNLSAIDYERFKKTAQPIEKPQLPTSWKKYLQQYIKATCQNLPTDAQEKKDNPLFGKSEMGSLMWIWDSCVYTLRALEMYYRVLGRPFKNELSFRHESCLSALIKANCLYASNLAPPEFQESASAIKECIFTVFTHQNTSVLEWNCFSMMVYVIFMLPSLLFATISSRTIVTTGSMMDLYTMQYFLLGNILKAIVLYEAPSTEEEDTMDVDEEFEQEVKTLPSEVYERIVKLYRNCNLQARRQALKTFNESRKDGMIREVDKEQIYGGIECNMKTVASLFEYIKLEMREYLRCCCLFFHYVTDVEFHEDLAPSGSDTFENMCKYLGLQTSLGSYFTGSYFEIMESFGDHPDIAKYNFDSNLKSSGAEYAIVPCTRPIPKLAELPEDYSDLINSVSDFICPNNEREEMKSPTMCLTCGEIICGQSYCCQPELDDRSVGACTYHIHSCGAEVGIFLRIRDCQIVYLGRNKGCFVQAPYLDEYGETDQGLRRGNPLRLCRERYSKIQLTWLSNGLHEEIARLNDNNSVSVTQWHHM